MPAGDGVSLLNSSSQVKFSTEKGFYINLPAGAVAVSFLWFVKIPGLKHNTPVLSNIQTTLKSLDLVGFVLFAPTAIMFLLALQWGGNAYRWDSAVIIGLFCGAGGIFAIFLGWEYKVGDEAMIPFGMMQRTIIVTSCITVSFVAANLTITSYYMAIYFQAVRGRSPLMAGVYLLPSVLSQLFISVLGGVLSWYPPKRNPSLLLTVLSIPSWVLLTMGNWRNCRNSHWLRLDEHIYSHLLDRYLDRIPNYFWFGPWSQHTNSTLSPIPLSAANISC